MTLKSAPCQDKCNWGPTDEVYEDKPLFACGSCGSQWVRTESWTPKQLDGSVPPGVKEEVIIARPWAAFSFGND